MLRTGAAVLVTLAALAGALDAGAAEPGGLLLVANKGDHTLGINDPDAGKMVATVKQSGVVAARKVTAVVTVAKRAQRIALSTDGRFVFTADQDAPRLAVIDTRANELVRGVALPAVACGTAPTPDGRFLLMALPGANQVGVLDLASMELVEIDLDLLKVGRLIQAGPMADGLAWAAQR